MCSQMCSPDFFFTSVMCVIYVHFQKQSMRKAQKISFRSSYLLTQPHLTGANSLLAVGMPGGAAQGADGKEPQRTRKHNLTQTHALARLWCGLMAAQDGRRLDRSVSIPALTFLESPCSSRVAALCSNNPVVTQNAPFVSYLPGSYTLAIWSWQVGGPLAVFCGACHKVTDGEESATPGTH